MNPEQKILILNECFETGGKYKCFGNICKFWYLEIFPGTSTFENEIRKYVIYATSDLPAFPRPRALKILTCRSPFQKLLDLEMPVKSSV